MRQTILIFGGLSIALLLLFELSKYSILASSGQSLREVFVVVSGILFVAIGFLINRFFYKPPGIASANPNLSQGQSQLSNQEHKVLILMADGKSNLEIAEALFIAESTVKSHVSNILSKLNARRRTEAVRIGRDLEII